MGRGSCRAAGAPAARGLQAAQIGLHEADERAALARKVLLRHERQVGRVLLPLRRALLPWTRGSRTTTVGRLCTPDLLPPVEVLDRRAVAQHPAPDAGHEGLHEARFIKELCSQQRANCVLLSGSAPRASSAAVEKMSTSPPGSLKASVRHLST